MWTSLPFKSLRWHFLFGPHYPFPGISIGWVFFVHFNSCICRWVWATFHSSSGESNVQTVHCGSLTFIPYGCSPTKPGYSLICASLVPNPKTRISLSTKKGIHCKSQTSHFAGLDFYEILLRKLCLCCCVFFLPPPPQAIYRLRGPMQRLNS